jgi:hypothetical protein
MAKPMVAIFRHWPMAAALLCASGASAAEPDQPSLAFAFEELVTLGADIPVGRTAIGERNIVPITGGAFSGPGLKGIIMGGSWDWQLIRADGCRQLKADYMLKTDDGAIVNVVNTAVSCRGKTPGAVTRTHPLFEPPLGKYEWLGQTAFVGTLDPVTLPGGQRAVRIRFYKVN